MNNFIEHIIEPDRLLLSWQAQDSKVRSRYIVGELQLINNNVVLNYFPESEDYKIAIEKGFIGYPAFRVQKSNSYNNLVIEAFMRRLPPKSRRDYNRYLELRGLSPTSEISDFALLGYTGAKLPDDGFELIHPFENVANAFELIIEIAGFRHRSQIPTDELNIDSQIKFFQEPENKSDSDAIRIEHDGKILGYVDRGRTELFNKYLNSGYELSGKICRKNGVPERPLIYIYVNIKLQ
jgi:hypothetical protein